MKRLEVDLSDSAAEHLQREAQKRGMTVSEYARDLLERQVLDQWPEGFFERVAGGWKGDALERPPQDELESREQI
ncbi:MAG: hypothetical protein ACLFVJ_01880 [Persicimonas sp.]